MYQKVRKLLIFLIQNWNYFDFSVKSEFIDILQYYRDLVIYNKYNS